MDKQTNGDLKLVDITLQRPCYWDRVEYIMYTFVCVSCYKSNLWVQY